MPDNTYTGRFGLSGGTIVVDAEYIWIRDEWGCEYRRDECTENNRTMASGSIEGPRSRYVGMSATLGISHMFRYLCHSGHITGVSVSQVLPLANFDKPKQMTIWKYCPMQ